MLSIARRLPGRGSFTSAARRRRYLTTSTTPVSPSSPSPPPPPPAASAMAGGAAGPGKREGDISDSFASLSRAACAPLPERFRALKQDLVAGREAAVVAGWRRLLARLAVETEAVARAGSAVVPQLTFADLRAGALADAAGPHAAEVRRRGVVVVKGTIPAPEARAYKEEIEEYVRRNPSTRAFPQHDPQVYELYWTSAQLKARAHPRLLETQRALMGLWKAGDAAAAISTSQPLAYADRLRIRRPGDAAFALGPHMDGGSVERWEAHGYGGRAGAYQAVFAGAPEAYDAWDAGARVAAVTDNYGGLGACSMLRLWQGWLALSPARPREGTLLVNPLLPLATAYMLLRPFFRPRRTAAEAPSRDAYLHEDNWVFTAGEDMTSALPGAEPGFGQELNDDLHPHLDLNRTMIHIPPVEPGDYVAWHCDTIHAVDKVHAGTADSAVLYIPACPTTAANARYLTRQREAFTTGAPGPDFPGGAGESRHAGRCGPEFLHAHAGADGLRAAGLAPLVAAPADTAGARRAVAEANGILGWSE